VFVSGFVLIDNMRISNIFRLMGGLTLLLGGGCLALDRWLLQSPRENLQNYKVTRSSPGM